ncbi:MAG TPA: ribosome biogenesis GTPase Der, partial [Casimicrobiaceae bacterium]|nr:ribosome biogenesis GTPase Der [Casimicrobiaceae bacterium]
MLPTIALVGRPNVGKSTLFNRLTKTRNALVADYPGLTRDRHYGRASAGDREYIVVDTGGFEPVATSGIYFEMAKQAQAAIAESDVVVLIVDARSGLTPQDSAIAQLLRRSGRPVVVAVNKAEGLVPERAVAEFHELALGEPLAVSAAHGENVHAMIETALERIPVVTGASARSSASGMESRIKVAVVGRPNVGKSTLANALVGEERLVTFDEPGTTRDAIYVDFDRGGGVSGEARSAASKRESLTKADTLALVQPRGPEEAVRQYTLIDTAGVRRRGKVFESIEKFSVIKTLQAIEDANVVILLFDAQDGISEQDAHLAGHVLEAGRAVVIGINKWDGLAEEQRDAVKRDIERKLAFLSFAQHHFISAKEGRGVEALLGSVDRAYAAAMAKLSTPRLTRALQSAVERQQPPRAGLVRPKM